MLVITDNRTDHEKHLCDIMPSGFFIWGDDLYRRIEENIEVSLTFKGDNIPAVHQRTGDLTLIGREAWVVPCSCEMTIIE